MNVQPATTAAVTIATGTAAELVALLQGAEADPTKIGAEYLPNAVVTNSVAEEYGEITSLPLVNETIYLQSVTPTLLEDFTIILPSLANSIIGQTKTFISSKPITVLTIVPLSGVSLQGTTLTSALAFEPYVFQYVSTGIWLRLV